MGHKVDIVIEELLVEYERTELHCILFYSSNKSRDFGILEKKVKDYRERIKKALAEDGNIVRAISEA